MVVAVGLVEREAWVGRRVWFGHQWVGGDLNLDLVEERERMGKSGHVK